MARPTAPMKHRPLPEHGAVVGESNAGLVLDGYVLLVNLLLIDTLVDMFLVAIADARIGSDTALYGLLAFAVALFCLQPAGAMLKRWRHHLGRPARSHPGSGCLFHPVFYFLVQLLIYLTIVSVAAEYVFVIDLRASFARFSTMLATGLVLAGANTWIVYRYFDRPSRAPRSALLRSAAAARLGDLCLFANMLGFQLLWNLFARMDVDAVDGVEEFLGRLLVVGVLALLFYLPPRLVYLAEDLHRPVAWISMTLANTPLLYRVLAGTGATAAIAG